MFVFVLDVIIVNDIISALDAILSVAKVDVAVVPHLVASEAQSLYMVYGGSPILDVVLESAMETKSMAAEMWLDLNP